MTDARQMRADNYRIKHELGFRCSAISKRQGQDGERCENRDQLLVVEMTDGLTGVLCPHHLAEADGRSVKVRPHQWDEAEELRERIRKDGPSAA